MQLNNALIIIESPNKTKKIAEITGAKVIATAGHFKGLSKEVVKDFTNYEPIFEFTDDKKKNNIFYALREAENKEVYIATDPDREGYAIGYFFYLLLKNKNVKSIKRAEFFEITPSGIEKGINSAIPFSQTNFKLFESWKARAVGDKLVGFILSPKYSQVFKEKMSVGRVQTPCLNFIVQRAKEIATYENLPLSEKIDYKIKAFSQKQGIEFNLLNHHLYNNKEEALSIIADLPLKAKCYSIEIKEAKSSPKAPYRTSQLQESLSKILGISTKEIMDSAQKLFEKGLITYHRTDSNMLSKEFLDELESHLKDKEYYQKREYKAGSQSQAEAHEAIRITHYHPLSQMDTIAQENELKTNEIEVYRQIYYNTILSQAKDCINEVTTYTFMVKNLPFILKNTQCKYKGFKGVFDDKDDENEKTEEVCLNLVFNKEEEIEISKFETFEVKKNQPKIYKESNFVSLLEKNEIGRPSTYATFLPLLLERGYVILEKQGKEHNIIPTAKGITLIDKLKIQDEWITQAEFTKQMEGVLDEIAKGNCTYLDFIKPLHQKMEFASINSALKPSQKQIDYLKGLLGDKEIPQEALDSKEVCEKLIDELKALKPQSNKPASEKQIYKAEKIAKEQNLKLPTNYKEDWKICSDFISKNDKKK